MKIKAFIALAIVTLLATIASTNYSPPPDLLCPDEASGLKIETDSGSQTIDGVTVTWGNSQVSVSGGSVTFCVKAATSNSGKITLNDGETWTVDWLNDGGQTPAISHIVIYGVVPPPPPACSSVGEWTFVSETDWVYNDANHTRTKVQTFEKYDLNDPFGVCDTKTEDVTESATLYCVNGVDTWFWPGDTVPSDGTLGACVTTPTPPTPTDPTPTEPTPTNTVTPTVPTGTPISPPITGGEGGPPRNSSPILPGAITAMAILTIVGLGLKKYLPLAK